MYTILIDKINFKKIFEYIFKTDTYETSAYKLPRILAKNILTIFICIFNIISHAYKIIKFINKFSRKIISI